MLGRVYIKDKEVYLIYEGNIITERTGCIYDVGYHFTGFTWLDMDYLRVEYKKFVDFLMKQMYYTEKPDFDTVINNINAYADEINKLSPYLHFYSQALYDFILVYGRNRAEAFEKLIYSATDCIEMIDTVVANIREECEMKYVMSGELRNHEKHYECDILEEILDGMYLALSVILIDIEKKRNRLVSEFDFISSEKENLKDVTANQRLFLLDLKRKNNGEQTYYTGTTLKSSFLPTSPSVWKNTDFDTTKDTLVDKKIEIVQMYELLTLDDLFRFEFFNIISQELRFKKCKYCGYYFVPIGRSDIEYCSRVNVGENKPCDQVGAMKRYQAEKENDEVYTAFKKAYRRMNSRTRNKKMTQSAFLEWSTEARKKRDDCTNGVITFEGFLEWLG